MIVISKKDWVSIPSLFRLTLPGHPTQQGECQIIFTSCLSVLNSPLMVRGEFSNHFYFALFQRIQPSLEQSLGIGRVMDA